MNLNMNLPPDVGWNNYHDVTNKTIFDSVDPSGVRSFIKDFDSDISRMDGKFESLGIMSISSCTTL